MDTTKLSPEQKLARAAYSYVNASGGANHNECRELKEVLAEYYPNTRSGCYTINESGEKVYL